jgi:hypothetical protein
MSARRSIAGFVAVMAASLGLALAGLGSTEDTDPIAQAPRPAPSTSAPPASAPTIVPTAAPTILRTPLVEPSVGASPNASPAAPNLQNVLRALVPQPGISAAPAQNYASFVRGAEHVAGVLDMVRKDDKL